LVFLYALTGTEGFYVFKSSTSASLSVVEPLGIMGDLGNSCHH
jgi:hypothetical protein